MLFIIFILVSFTVNSLAQGSWVEQVSGVNVSLNSAVNSNWYGHAWVCGNNGTVLRTTNLGTNWINVSGNGIPNDINLNVISDSYLNSSGAIVSGVKNDTAIVYRTSNSGLNWNVVFRQYNSKINGIDVNYLYGFMIGNPVAGRWSVWKTTNDGLTWDSTGLYIQQNNNETGWNNSFTYVNENIFFGTNNNRFYLSTNNGITWTFKTFSYLGSVTGLIFSSFGSGYYNGYIAGPGKVYFTSNNGNNWISDSLMPGTGNVVGIVKQPLPVDLFGFENLFITRGDNRILFLGNSSFNWLVSYTAPSGNYKHISNRMPFDYFAVRDNGGISYCGCMLGGINNLPGEIPETFSLSQNYPNPFNPVTNIKFEIPKAGLVKITIFDLLGREITTLINQPMQPGRYNVNWDASNYPSSVFFYKLETENFTGSKKMVLIK